MSNDNVVEFKKHTKPVEQPALINRPEQSAIAKALKRTFDEICNNTTWNPDLSFEDEIIARLYIEGYRIVPISEGE